MHKNEGNELFDSESTNNLFYFLVYFSNWF